MPLSYFLFVIPHSSNFWIDKSQQITDSLFLESIIQKAYWPHLGMYNTLLLSNLKCNGKMFLRAYSKYLLERVEKKWSFQGLNRLSTFDNQIYCNLFQKHLILFGKSQLLEGEGQNKECHLSIAPIFVAFPELIVFLVFLKAIEFPLRDLYHLFFIN